MRCRWRHVDISARARVRSTRRRDTSCRVAAAHSCSLCCESRDRRSRPVVTAGHPARPPRRPPAPHRLPRDWRAKNGVDLDARDGRHRAVRRRGRLLPIVKHAAGMRMLRAPTGRAFAPRRPAYAAIDTRRPPRHAAASWRRWCARLRVGAAEGGAPSAAGNGLIHRPRPPPSVRVHRRHCRRRMCRPDAASPRAVLRERVRRRGRLHGARLGRGRSGCKRTPCTQQHGRPPVRPRWITRGLGSTARLAGALPHPALP